MFSCDAYTQYRGKHSTEPSVHKYRSRSQLRAEASSFHRDRHPGESQAQLNDTQHQSESRPQS